MNIPSPSPSLDPSRIQFTGEGLKAFGIFVVAALVCWAFAALTNKGGD